MVFATILTCLVIPESPRWLIALGHLQDAKKILEKGAKLNKKKLPTQATSVTIKQVDKPEKKIGITSLFKDKFAATITIIMIANWTAANLCYYGLSLNAVNLAGTDPYLNFALTGLIEIPSYIFAAVVIDRIGRKPLLILCQLLAGTGCLAAGLIDSEEKAAVTAMTLIGLS